MQCPYAYIWRGFDDKECVYCYRIETLIDDEYIIFNCCRNRDLCDIEIVTEYLKYMGRIFK